MTTKIQSIEIYPGSVKTFKVFIEGGGTVVVDAEALNDLRWFNRACIDQTNRSLRPISSREWSAEVDRALCAAMEPEQLVEEQMRRHGTDTWHNQPAAWLVRERLPAQGVGLLSGIYSSFKSFLLLDTCGCVMTELPFLKAKVVRRGGVLIFAAEGASDLPMRVTAMIEHRLARETVDDPDLFKRSKIDLDRLPFSYVAHCRPLRAPKTVEWMVAKASEAQTYFQSQFGLDLVLIGIDTMAAAAGWDNENDAAQAQIVMNHLADVSKATNTFVVAVDHFGKTLAAGTRGSVVKECSADVLLAVLGERDEETHVVTDTRLVLQKLRSGPQGLEFPFVARVVEMGHDRDGAPLTSRVIDWNVERQEKVKPEKKSPAELIMDQALDQTFKTKGKRVAMNGTQVDAVCEEDLRSAFRDLYQQCQPGTSMDAIGEARRRAFKKMQGRIMQGTVEGVVYLWFPPLPY
jgi:hypothetical protein